MRTSPLLALNTLDLPKPTLLVDELNLIGKNLVMTMGKGGVGKTTAAASVAAPLAKQQINVHHCVILACNQSTYTANLKIDFTVWCLIPAVAIT